MRRTSLAAVSLAVVAAVALAGCAPSGAEATGGSGAGGNKSGVATGQGNFDTVFELTDQFGTDAAAGEFPRTVHNITANETLGDTEIPEKPERIIALDTGELDNLLALGIKPIAYSHSDSMTQVPEYLDTGDAVDLGGYGQLDLEQVKNLEPDLIIGSSLRIDDDGLKEQLQEIAPTVLSVRPGLVWKDNFELFATAVGEEEKAAELLEEYDARIKEVGEEVIEANGGEAPTISMLRFMSGKIRLYGNYSFIGVILQDAGLPRTEIEDIDELQTEITAEEITQAKGDWLLWGTYGDPAATDQDAVVDGPLWGEVPAVKNGSVVEEVPDEIWYLGLGTVGAGMVLDQLEGIAANAS